MREREREKLTGFDPTQIGPATLTRTDLAIPATSPAELGTYLIDIRFENYYVRLVVFQVYGKCLCRFLNYEDSRTRIKLRTLLAPSMDIVTVSGIYETYF